jgi:hypothetical protein
MEAGSVSVEGGGPRAGGTQFARWVFRIAGIYGLVVLLPQYLLEDRIGRDDPPAITHPEYFYGFVGVAVVWQFAFLVIATDPARYRPLMIPAVLEKAAFGLAVPILFAQGRASGTLLAFGIIDLVLGVLFAAALWRLRARLHSEKARS